MTEIRRNYYYAAVGDLKEIIIIYIIPLADCVWPLGYVGILPRREMFDLSAPAELGDEAVDD